MEDSSCSLQENLFLEDGVALDDIDEMTIQPQRPRFLWIGCSDARVPESVMNLAIDQIFVHRNIANQFPTNDRNARSFLTYGVKYITNNPVQEVRVVGHTNCGGVIACHDAVQPENPKPLPNDPYLREWLMPLLELAKRDPNQSVRALTEENVRIQVHNVRKVLDELNLPRQVKVKGFVYHIAERELREIACDTPVPALPSGMYRIINRVNGEVHVDLVNDDISVLGRRVVANTGPGTWVLKHLGDCEYHISAMVLPSTVGGSAVERKKLCFLMDCVQPDVWVICGKDSMDTTDRRKVYMIKKKERNHFNEREGWMLPSRVPGTQVEVKSPPPLDSRPECEVHFVPYQWTWYIERVDRAIQ